LQPEQAAIVESDLQRVRRTDQAQRSKQMAKPVTHLSHITNPKNGCTHTTTLCNHMTSGEINCSTDISEVTCKICLKYLAKREAA